MTHLALVKKRFFVGILFLTIASDYLPADEPAKLIGRLEAYLAKVKSIESRFETQHVRIQDLKLPTETSQLQSETNGEFRCESIKRFHLTETMKARGKEYKSEVLYDGTDFISATFDPEAGIALQGCLKPRWSNPEQAFHISGTVLSFVLGYHHPDFLPKDKGLIALTEFIRKNGSLRSMVQPNGNPVLEWNGSQYRISIELSANESDAPRAIVYRPIKATSINEPQVVDLLEVEAIEFQKIDGISFPTVVKMVRRLSEGKGFDGDVRRPSAVASTTKFSSIGLNPAFQQTDFKWQAEIPNYSAARMLDAEHLQFYWLDGKIVPATDLEAARIAQLSAVNRMNTRTNWTKWWVGGALVLLLSGLAVVLQIIRRKKG